jgi:hypothetical protein
MFMLLLLEIVLSVYLLFTIYHICRAEIVELMLIIFQPFNMIVGVKNFVLFVANVFFFFQVHTRAAHEYGI